MKESLDIAGKLAGEISENLKFLNAKNVVIDFNALLRVNLMHNPFFLKYFNGISLKREAFERDYSITPKASRIQFIPNPIQDFKEDEKVKKFIKSWFVDADFLRKFFSSLKQNSIGIEIISRIYDRSFMQELLEIADLKDIPNSIYGYESIIADNYFKGMKYKTYENKFLYGKVLLIDNDNLNEYDQVPPELNDKVIKFEDYPRYNKEAVLTRAGQRDPNYYGLNYKTLCILRDNLFAHTREVWRQSRMNQRRHVLSEGQIGFSASAWSDLKTKSKSTTEIVK